jgi:predicted transcriptional regulator
MQVTTIELPEDLHREVKHQAIDENVSFKALVQKALEQYMKLKERS